MAKRPARSTTSAPCANDNSRGTRWTELVIAVPRDFTSTAIVSDVWNTSCLVCILSLPCCSDCGGSGWQGLGRVVTVPKCRDPYVGDQLIIHGPASEPTTRTPKVVQPKLSECCQQSGGMLGFLYPRCWASLAKRSVGSACGSRGAQG